MNTDRRSMLFAGTAILLAAAATLGAPLNIVQYAISPNGVWGVELSDWAKPTQIELRSHPVPSSAWKKLGGPLKPDYDVSAFLISEDSTRVIYREGRTATGDWALFSAPIIGGFWDRISQPAKLGSSVDAGFRLSGGNRVRYLYTPDGSPSKWYVVGVTGGEIKEWVIFTDGFEGGTTGGWR